MLDLNPKIGAASTERADSTARSVDDEPPSARLDGRAPSFDRRDHAIPPSADTGATAAVMQLHDGDEHDEIQDSYRTSAEAQAVHEEDVATFAVRALIIEDAFELAEILQITLRRLKISAVHESYGNRAFERFHDIQPQIVLLDISLPDIPGWEVLEKIKEHSRTTGAPMPLVIVITAFGDPANRLIGKLHDVFRYLIKPFTPREVEQVVKEAMTKLA